MPDRYLGYLLAASALALFAWSTLVTKAASSRINLPLGFLVATTTNVVMCAVLLAVQWIIAGVPQSWNMHALLLFAISGVFSTYLGRWFFYESVVRFGPSRASVFQVSSPLFTALMAWWLLGETLTATIVAGMLVTVAGLMLVSYKPGFFSRSRAPVHVATSNEAVVAVDGDGAGVDAGLHVMVCNAGTPVASHPVSHPAAHPTRETGVWAGLLQSVLVLGMGSSLAYAVGNLLRGSAIRVWDEPILGALASAVLGLTMHWAFTKGKAEIASSLRTADRRGVWMYVGVGAATILAQIFSIASMRYIPLSIATLITLCSPVLVFPLSFLIYKNSDRVTGLTVLGCLLALIGIVTIAIR
ncbi:MAG: DMT family transporter [Variovorax sp.]